MVPNIGYYVQSVDQIVKETETIGESMHPKYERIREAIDQNKLTELSHEELKETVELFENGTKKYRELLKKISSLRPPAKAMGIHKKFEKAYLSYVAGCEEMTQSIQLEKGVDAELFNAAEAKQDQATDDISAAIQKMTNLLLKK
ncbi:hypothetical protein A5844_001980 [Enterococcus sp. 10A9_DIV0425]|uniref:Uncharacterized protein n=1 Tax=Candidatus Enterococcus wittei TaxID=1987383 RepID=A0A242JZC6_9ENTE|nr:hypothetical protein [Enterococcus sp. 10A9_DIV0425]OTP10281.1 hypothetical protein A5844_001980 [Enterococcus sp. 10A9_DIV0425]THE10899.1 hypothetical protein E1H99_09140 [Enterococcus hirae]